MDYFVRLSNETFEDIPAYSGNDRTLQSIATGNKMARPKGSLPTAQYQQENVADEGYLK